MLAVALQVTGWQVAAAWAVVVAVIAALLTLLTFAAYGVYLLVT